MCPGKGSPIVIQKRELHGFWAAKNCVAFLRNSRGIWQWRQCKTEGSGTPVQVCENTAAVAAFANCSARVLAGHAKPDGIVKQDCDPLAGR